MKKKEIRETLEQTILQDRQAGTEISHQEICYIALLDR